MAETTCPIQTKCPVAETRCPSPKRDARLSRPGARPPRQRVRRCSRSALRPRRIVQSRKRCPATDMMPGGGSRCPPALTTARAKHGVGGQRPVVQTQCPRRTFCPVAETLPSETKCPGADAPCPPTATQCPSGETFCPVIATLCPPTLTQCPVAGTLVVPWPDTMPGGRRKFLSLNPPVVGAQAAVAPEHGCWSAPARR